MYLRKQNKGEWSEYDTKISIMGGETIRLINLDKQTSETCTVQSIQTSNKEYRMLGNSIYETVYKLKNKELISANENEDEATHRFVCFKNEIKSTVALINKKIRQGKGSFSILEAELLAKKLGIDTACDYSHNKGDVILKFIDMKTGEVLPAQSFSLKSFVGKNPTILNSSINSTKVRLLIKNVPIVYLKDLKQKKFKVRENMNALIDLNAQFPEIKYSDTMEENLSYLKAKRALTYAIVSHFTKDFKEASKMTILEDLLEDHTKDSFNYSMKSLLRASLIGMNPAQYWDGVATMSDNILLKTPDGQYTAFFGKDTVESYLYNFCYIDTPSQSRHNYGYLYEENGEWYIDLNFQIRLTNLTKTPILSS